MSKLEDPELTVPSDKTLVRAVLAGERKAYEELYDLYAPLVRAICYDVTNNLADAQDLAQDVFMRAYERLGHLRKPDCFGKWVIGIARLRCREWQRATLRSRGKFIKLEHAESVSVNPSSDRCIERLRKTIRALPEKERLALHTFYLQSESAEDARRIVGLSRSGFYRVLERARKRLERLLAEERDDIR